MQGKVPTSPWRTRQSSTIVKPLTLAIRGGRWGKAVYPAIGTVQPRTCPSPPFGYEVERSRGRAVGRQPGWQVREASSRKPVHFGRAVDSSAPVLKLFGPLCRRMTRLRYSFPAGCVSPEEAVVLWSCLESTWATHMTAPPRWRLAYWTGEAAHELAHPMDRCRLGADCCLGSRGCGTFGGSFDCAAGSCRTWIDNR